MRGTGFEPADLYRTAPSTLRRWPSLATHARWLSAEYRTGGFSKTLAFRLHWVGALARSRRRRFQAATPGV